jgi:hypothetical protein
MSAVNRRQNESFSTENIKIISNYGGKFYRNQSSSRSFRPNYLPFTKVRCGHHYWSWDLPVTGLETCDLLFCWCVFGRGVRG